jgi:predicted DsbA family dithiol-disulfide isomerase
VKITHFPLHPDTPEEGLTLEQLFAGRDFDVSATQVRMAGLMAEEGLPYGERTMTYNSRLAQELAKWAETQPRGEAIHDALFRAYFVDGLNIARIDNLVQVAEQVGLPGNVARDVLVSHRFRHSVDADWQRSTQLRVTAVPTFVVNNQGLVGAQSYDDLERLLLKAGVEPNN